MARVGGGTCLLSPDVMRLAPLRDDLRPCLAAPSPPLEDFPAARFCYLLGNLHTLHGLRRAARVSVGSSSAYLVDLYRFDAPVYSEDSIASRHRLGFQSFCNLRCKNLLQILRIEESNVVVNQTLNP